MHRIKALAAQAAVSLAAVSLVTAFFAAVHLTANRAVIRQLDPVDQPALEHLRQAAARYSGDEALKEAFRDTDSRVRARFYRARSFSRRGTGLLAGACLVGLLSLHAATVLLRRPPLPGKTPRESDPAGAMARQGLLAAAASAIVLGIVMARTASFDPHAMTAAPPAAATADRHAPEFDALRGGWTSFRGTGGTGVAEAQTAPLEWDGGSGRAVRWKARLPRPGFNSPVIWENRLFLTGADKEAREVYGLDADTGGLLWTVRAENIVGSPEKLPDVTEDTGFAAASAATDGRCVYAIFATGDVICVTTGGERVWARNLGVPDNPYGHSSSLLVHAGRLLVQYDHFASARLLALDVATGETLWEAERDVAASWASPMLVRLQDRVAIVLNAEPFVEAFDAVTGERLWSVECMGGEVAPSPATSDGLAFVTTDYVTLAAIRLSGSEAGTIAWQTDEELPDVASPVAADGLLFVATSAGILSCWRATDGELLWREDTEEGAYASPIIAAGRLYVPDRKGVTRVFRAAATPELLATNALGEPIVATPAILSGRIYLRGLGHLYCIGE